MQASQSNLSDALAECLDAMALGPWAPVSYTHLTLPTNREV